MQTWASDIDLAIRRDKRDPRDLCLVAKYVHNDDEDTFWRPNVMSAAKLRKHFDRLYLKMKQEENPYGVQP